MAIAKRFSRIAADFNEQITYLLSWALNKIIRELHPPFVDICQLQSTNSRE